MACRKLVLIFVAGGALLLPAAMMAGTSRQVESKDQLFQSAVALYEAGKYAEAIAPLEKLVKEVPDTFEVQELLGLVYAAQSENAKANEHLARAVRLRPGSA